MQSVRFHEFGEPEAVLRVEDVTQPAPGAGEVLVRMRARSVNPSDVLTVRGLYGQLPRLPATPGLEGMGEVEETGAGVVGIAPGQRVIPLGIAGTWSEFLVVPQAQLIPVPDEVSDETAAQFVVNPLTAWAMLIEDLQMKPGEWLLQTAAGSTLGRVVLQLAKVKGFKTINVVRRREQIAELERLGADACICSDDEDIAARVREITGKEAVTKAIDAVGGATGAAALSALGRGGVLLVYGLLSGEPLPLDSGRMIFTTTTARGFWLTDWMRRTPPAEVARVTGELLALMGAGEIIPPVEATYPLAEVKRAIQHAERQGRSGKVLLVS